MRIENKNMLLLALFPYADKKHRTALRKLADEKGIDWQRKEISEVLHDLMGSIIRHRYTHYDSCVATVGKDRARFYVQGYVTQTMRMFKGEG